MFEGHKIGVTDLFIQVSLFILIVLRVHTTACKESKRKCLSPDETSGQFLVRVNP